jgi:serine/threonine-protein kinase
MGVVWRVRDLQFHRTLAVKVMKSRVCDNAEQVRRFIAEAQITGQLAHPFIVPVHAMGQLPDGRPYYSMKLVEGQTLAAHLEGRPTPAHRRMEFVHVFAQVCQAVAFAHSKGVIHRDLKPQNVMVGEHGEVQVMDWGLAKVLPDTRSAFPSGAGEASGAALDTWREGGYQTHDGSVLGTPAYMPPEQARGPVAEVDRRSDVFGLGAILCEILTDEPPYRVSDRPEVLRQAMAADLADALGRLRRCGADPELIRLAEQCLAPRKSDRPADAGEVAAAVAAYLSEVQEQLQQERLAREREQVRAAEQRRRRKLWMGLAVTVLTAVGLAAAGGLYWQHRLTRQQQAVGQTLDRAEDLISSGALTEARALLEQVEPGLEVNGSADSRQRLADLERLLRLVEELDKVRLTRVTWTNGCFDCSSALQGYKQAFVRAGMDPTDGELERVVWQIHDSIVRQRLVAAIDDWAYVAERERRREPDPSRAEQHRRQRDRLLEVARQADPDPILKDKVRDPRLWERPDQLRLLAEHLDPATTSAELLVLVGTLLSQEDREVLWRKGLVSHAGDFWLNAELGTLLMIRATNLLPTTRPGESHWTGNPFLPRKQVSKEAAELAAQAAGFYQAALALRPQAVGVYLDLSGAMALKGDLSTATAYCRQATRLEPANAEVQEQLDRVLHAMGDPD